MKSIYEFLIGINIDLLNAVLLTVLFTVEQIFSGTASFSRRAPHLLTNVILQACYILINYGLAVGVIWVFDWVEKGNLGLLNMISISFYAKVAIGIICIDFVNYWAHRLYHTWELFWRLHRVHHSDTALDTSSSYRFHPLDALLDNGAAVVAAIVFGLHPSSLLIWFIFYIPVLVMHHSAFIMPTWFDRTFGMVIVSPNFHKVHHHQLQEYTDSNYGQLFIFWDKMFGTFRKLPVSDIKFGLQEFDRPDRQQTWFLIKSPFNNLRKEE
ncbi:MAG TPA: sterol desaturase family protein [Cyclobacteriaceae bacterium]|nr:sterol desaturase family protein [Cyclobacteriaceae bacterium]